LVGKQFYAYQEASGFSKDSVDDAMEKYRPKTNDEMWIRMGGGLIQLEKQGRELNACRNEPRSFQNEPACSAEIRRTLVCAVRPGLRQGVSPADETNLDTQKQGNRPKTTRATPYRRKHPTC
jgi:hypothetical protein